MRTGEKIWLYKGYGTSYPGTLKRLVIWCLERPPRKRACGRASYDPKSNGCSSSSEERKLRVCTYMFPT